MKDIELLHNIIETLKNQNESLMKENTFLKHAIINNNLTEDLINSLRKLKLL